MDQRWVKNFMPAAVSFAEDETRQPLRAGFAGSAKSGLSFGAMQSDIAANPAAYDGLRDILVHDNDENGYPIIPPDRVSEILNAGAQKGIKRDQFESQVPGGIGQVDAALARNPDMVAAQDEDSAFNRRSDVANAIGAAARNPHGPANWEITLIRDSLRSLARGQIERET